MFKSQVKDVRETIHKIDPNAIIRCVRLGEKEYIMSSTEISKLTLGDLDLPHPNGTLHTLVAIINHVS